MFVNKPLKLSESKTWVNIRSKHCSQKRLKITYVLNLFLILTSCCDIKLKYSQDQQTNKILFVSIK